MGCADGGAGDVDGHDYCVGPVPMSLFHNGSSHCTPEAPCPRCSGDCDSDGDCQDGLICEQRSSYDGAPTGCIPGGPGDIRGHDYCVPNPVR